MALGVPILKHFSICLTHGNNGMNFAVESRSQHERRHNGDRRSDDWG